MLLFRHIRRYIPFVFTLLIASFISSSAKDLTDIIADTYQELNISNTPGKHDLTPTLTYLDYAYLRSSLNYKYNGKIDEIGLAYIQEVIRTAIKHEIEFKDTHRVFYHGQMREFGLLQDMHQGLHEIACKKALQDYFTLRAPDKDFNRYTNVNAFLETYIRNGQIRNGYFNYSSDDVQKRLLSVNPSLFCNTGCSSSCSFYYFLHSQSCQSMHVTNIVKDLFAYFTYDNIFKKYETKIRKLENMLSSNEQGKTGILLQIFIPEKLVDTLAYRAVSGGCLYHTDEKPKKHPATKDLAAHTNAYLSGIRGSELDETQYRILINEMFMTPDSGIKMFRFCQQTNLIKKYKAKLKKLLETITKNIGQ